MGIIMPILGLSSYLLASLVIIVTSQDSCVIFPSMRSYQRGGECPEDPCDPKAKIECCIYDFPIGWVFVISVIALLCCSLMSCLAIICVENCGDFGCCRSQNASQPQNQAQSSHSNYDYQAIPIISGPE